MKRFLIINERTDDTLNAADDLKLAIEQARAAVEKAQTGDMITLLESGGKAIRQFVRQPDGTVIEQAIVSPAESINVGRS